MIPAAVLSVVVQAQGIAQANAQLMRLNQAGAQAAAGASRAEKAARGMGAGTAAAGNAADRASKQHRGLGGALAGVGASAKSMIGFMGAAGVVGAIGGAVKVAADFESQLNTLKSVSGATGTQMRQMSRLAKQLGADTKLPGTSAADAAEAMTEMSKAGLSLKDIMGGVRGTLVLSAAAGVSNARAAEIASNALNTFKLRGKDVGFVVDQLANTANASSVEIEDVADAMQMAGAVFSGFQGPVRGAKGALTDLNVAIGLLGNAGIKGSDAGTSLKQALLQVAAPAQKTKNLMRNLYLVTDGSARAQELFTRSIEGTTKKIRDQASSALEKLQGDTRGMGDIAYDAAGRMRSLPEIVDQVTRATKNMTQEQRNQAIAQVFGADATRSILALMKAGPAAWDKMSDAVNRQGAAQDLANSKMKGLKGSIEALKSAGETLAITLLEGALPAMTSLVGGVTALVGALDTSITWLKEHKIALDVLIVAVVAATAAFVTWKTVMVATAATTAVVTGGTTALAAILPALRVALLASAVAGGGFSGALVAVRVALLALPITWVLAALAAIVAGLVIAYKRSETFRDIVDGALRAVGAVFGWLAGAAGAALGVIVSVLKASWSVISSVTSATWGFLRGLLVGIWDALRSYFTRAWADIADAARDVWGVVRTVTTAVWGFIGPYVRGVWDAIRDAATFYFNAYRSIIAAVWNAVSETTRATWNALREFLGTLWRGLSDTAQTVWGGIRTAAGTIWQGVRDAIVNPVDNAITWVIEHTRGLRDTVRDIFRRIGDLAGDLGGWLKDGLTDAFKGAAKTVAQFAKLILEVIDKIPGVDTEPQQKAIDKFVDGLATGGRFGKGTGGGIVNSPIVMMGEEAPRHPEFVIPTNPAYRGRARGLLAQAASAIGFAQGGMYSQAEMAALWASENGPQPLVAGAIGMAESGGDPNAANGPYHGLWQIGPGGPFDPVRNAQAGIAKYWDSLRRRGDGWLPWEAYTGPDGVGSDGPWRDFFGGGSKGGGGGIIGAIGGAIGKVGGIVGDLLAKGAGFLIDQLPGVGSLPDWLQGMGKSVLSSVTGWIKSKVDDLLGGGGGPGGNVSGSVDAAIALAQSMGFAHPSPGQLTGGTHTAGSLHYAGRAVDFGDAGHTVQQMKGLFLALWNTFGTNLNELFYDLMPWYVDAHHQVPGQAGGHGDHIHAAFRYGGMWGDAPYVGSYRTGGVVPEDGMAYVHKGEEITPPGKRALVHVEQMIVNSEADVEHVAHRLAWLAEA